LFFWCVLFLGLTLMAYAVVPSSDISTLKERIRDVLLLTSLLGVFLMMPDQIIFVRKLVFWAVVLGVLVNLISLVDSIFLLSGKFIAAQRPAGLYINPNESATALILGMLLAIGVVAKTRRIPFVIWVFVGVAATFSREAILGWALVVTVLCISGTVNWKSLLLWISALVVALVLMVLVLIKVGVLNVFVKQFYSMQLHRLVWFADGIRSGTSADIRLKLLKDAWDLFLQHPWLGNGLGSTTHWHQAYSTHNMYLYYMDDYGIVGALLYPLLVWCIVYESREATRRIAWCMAIFMLFWGLFDHNVVHNYYALFSISLMAAMSKISARAGSPEYAGNPGPVRTD
ncbi:MAG: O-antigen ligase family protein, partial [Gammaproteobacteria bacterium]